MQITGDTGLDSAASTAGRQAATALDDLGYRHMYVEYLGRAHDFGLVYESLPIVEKTGWQEVRDPDPARVTYQIDRAVEEPDAKLGLSHDHAYWTSGLRISDGAASGVIDAIALPMASKLPKTTSHLRPGTAWILRPLQDDHLPFAPARQWPVNAAPSPVSSKRPLPETFGSR